MKTNQKEREALKTTSPQEMQVVNTDLNGLRVPSFAKVEQQFSMLKIALEATKYPITSNLRGLILASLTEGDVLITGKSGAGKDFIAESLVKSGMPRKSIFLLDSFGSQLNGKWIVNCQKLFRAIDREEDVICIGTCDNLSEVAQTLRSRYVKGSYKLTCIMIVPIPFLHISAAKAKAEEKLRSGGINMRWIEGWQEMIKWPIQKVIKHLVKELAPKFSKVGADKEILFINSVNKPLPITQGWHKHTVNFSNN